MGDRVVFAFGMDDFIFEIDDYGGIPVRLSRSVWEDKILSDSPIGHPEVVTHTDILPEAIQRPDVVFCSTRRLDTHLFYKLHVDEGKHHIVIVVKYVIENKCRVGYVTTVYLTGKLYSKGDILWTLQPKKTH